MKDPRSEKDKQKKVKNIREKLTLMAAACLKIEAVQQDVLDSKKASSQNKSRKNSFNIGIIKNLTIITALGGVVNKDQSSYPNSTPDISPQKNEETKEFFNSLKGYYSDCVTSRLRTKSQIDTTDNIGFDDFDIIKLIGKGAYGNVWLVKKKTTGDYYAMKTVDWADKNMHNRIMALKAEKEIYQALKGDFFVKAFWTFEYENLICFVTEYMPGGDFGKILDQFARLDESCAQLYFAELVEALESLHELGVVHKDLKPENMLIDSKGHVRLTDFGLSQKRIDNPEDNSNANTIKPKKLGKVQKDPIIKARMNALRKFCVNSDQQEKQMMKKNNTMFYFLNKDEECQRLTENKSLLIRGCNSKEKKPKMVGTPDYMAPEVISSERYDLQDYDEKCMDWWSMGAILYQMLVGIPPFCDQSIQAIFENIRKNRIEWPDIGDGEDCISVLAADLIHKLLNPDPKKRLGANGAAEVKKHPFFKGINWDKLREKVAPIIPCAMEEPQKCETGPLSQKYPETKSTVGSFHRKNKRSVDFIDFGAFKMRRIDLLDQANQQAHQNYVTHITC